MAILQSLEKNAEEIRQIQKEINRATSEYRKRDLSKRLRKLRKEREEAIRWLRKADGNNDSQI